MITDEMVEKVADIINPNWICSCKNPDCINSVRDRQIAFTKARAAVAAVLPDIVEACAKIADKHLKKGSAYSIPSAIRSRATGATLDGKTTEKATVTSKNANRRPDAS